MIWFGIFVFLCFFCFVLFYNSLYIAVYFCRLSGSEGVLTSLNWSWASLDKLFLAFITVLLVLFKGFDSCTTFQMNSSQMGIDIAMCKTCRFKCCICTRRLHLIYDFKKQSIMNLKAFLQGHNSRSVGILPGWGRRTVSGITDLTEIWCL